MKPIKIIHIDDERDARDIFSFFIKENFEHVELLGSAKTALEGIKMINELEPDVVFLDIKMPGGGGFEILDSLGKINFEVVFLTAFNNYAIEAIKKNAIDYILKPIDLDELHICFQKIDNKLRAEGLSTNQTSKLVINHINGVHFITINDILYLSANSNYTNIITQSGKIYTASKTLKDIEDKLPANQFFRTHRSYIVNLLSVEEIHYRDKIFLELSNKEEIPLSTSLKDDFLDKFNSQ